jgi:hypothetical protein
MAKIAVNANGLRLLASAMDTMADQAPFATALALTRTAMDVRVGLMDEMQRVFDSPTRWTLNGFRVFPAKPDNQAARVDFRSVWGRGTDARDYLAPQVFGTAQRKRKALEGALHAAGFLPEGWRVTPGVGARLDVHGNVSRGQVVQVLSQLRVTLTAGHTRNMSWDARKQIAAQQRAGGRYFVIRPDDKAAKSGTQPGVYLREWFVRGVTPVFIFVKAATYKPRLDMQAVGDRVADKVWNKHVEDAWKQAIATARQKLSAGTPAGRASL